MLGKKIERETSMAGNPKPKNQILQETAMDYLHTIDPKDPNRPSPSEIEETLLAKIDFAYSVQHNAVCEKTKRWAIPTTLPAPVIADIMAHLYDICTISCAGDGMDRDYNLLAIYQPEGEDKGIYTISEDTFRSIARQYNYSLTIKEFTEIMAVLRDKVPIKQRCTDRDLIAVNNGLFDYKTKTLHPFTPDKIFLAKSRVNYNPNACNPKITEPDGHVWDVETWVNELSDDPEITELLWQIIGCILRPNVRWNKSAWFFSESGNNGKGTLCHLMRNICGKKSCASISIMQFNKDFMLENLINAQAVINDENDVGTYVDKAANLKAVITNDVILINRKHKAPINYQFKGFMVQCLNEYPRVRDKSDSFYRRQLFVPFSKCYTGAEKKYIKEDYLCRQNVLEYVLYKVLNMDYYTLLEPAACTRALAEYKEFNDPIRQFWDEMKTQFVWDLLPFDFLYQLYMKWMTANMPNGGVQGKQTFINDLLNVLNPIEDGWMCMGKTKRIRPGTYIQKPEPLILEYNLDKWKNPLCTNRDINRLCIPKLATQYRGLLRTSISPPDDTPIDTTARELTQKG